MLFYPIETCSFSFSLWYPKFTFKWRCDSNWDKLWWNSYLQLWYRLHSDIGDTTRNVETFVHFCKGNTNADRQNILSYHVVACMQSEEW